MNISRAKVDSSILRALQLLLISACLLLAISCNSEHTAGTKEYRSAWIEMYPNSKSSKALPGTLQGDFILATEGTSLEEAKEKWGRFLSKHASKDGFYEDSMHNRYVKWAKGEIERIRLLEIGNSEEERKQFRKMKYILDQ